MNYSHLFRKLFNRLGRILFPDNISYAQTMEGGLYRSCQIRAISPSTILDVGAAEGKWSLLALKYWKKSKYILIEPLEERKLIIENICKQNHDFYFVNKGVGARKGTTDFYVTSDLDGSGISDNNPGTIKRTINLTSIDDEVRILNLKGPYIIKLDTHGYEVPILEGSKEVLKNTQLLIIECYGFRLAQNSLLFGEMCEYLKLKGFRLIDIVDISLRKNDGAFWQCDAFFIPDNSAVFCSNTYN